MATRLGALPTSSTIEDIIAASGSVAIEGQTFFDTRTTATLATLRSEIKTFSTGAFSALGDKGGGEYARRSTAPYTPWFAKDWTVMLTCQNGGLFYRCTRRPYVAETRTNTIPPTQTHYNNVVGADEYGWIRIDPNFDTQWVRTVDRYTLEGATDAVHGGWWELQLKGGEVFIEQMGGRADYSGSGAGGTDNWAPLMAAINWVQFDPVNNTAGDTSPSIRFGCGRYKFTKTVHVHNIMAIRGVYIGMDAFGGGASTQLWFTNTTGSAFCIYGNNTATVFDTTEQGGALPTWNNTGSGGGSVLEGFSIHGTWDHVTRAARDDYTAAVRARAIVKCIQVSVHSWRSNGFHIHATAGAGANYPFEGNANCWRLIDCYVHGCGGHALWIAGMDVNAGYSTNFITHQGPVKGCGIYDGSGLGNTHIQPQITGYGDRGVSHVVGGVAKQFCLISGSDIDGNTGLPITPGTNDKVWYYLRDGGINSSFPAWDVANSPFNIGLAIFGFSGLTTIVSPYVENNAIRSHSNGPIVGSGDSTWTRYTPNRGREATSNAWNFSSMSGPEADANGAGISRMEFGADHPAGGLAYGPQFFTWNRARHGDGVRGSFGWVGRDVFWQAAGQSLGNLNKYVFRITEKDTNIDYGNGVGADTTSRLVMQDPAISDLENFSQNPTVRIFGIREAQPTRIGTYSKGSRYQNAHSGGAGTIAQWICSQSGTIHEYLWSSGVTTGGGSIFKVASSGKFYQSAYYGTSTTEPTHTSGTVTLDVSGAQPWGIPWTYLGTTAPEFVLDAVVVKQTSAWTVNNPTVDRTVDVSADDLAATRAALGTLIADLKLAGVLT